MIIKFCFLIAASIAVYKIKQINNYPLNPAKCCVIESGTGEEEKVEENQSDKKEKKQFESDEEEEKNVRSNEVNVLRNLVNELEDRVMNLEKYLFVYYGLKEQEVAVDELKRLLKIKGDEIEMLQKTISSLQDETKELQVEITRGSLEKKQLEIARTKIEELETKIRFNANRTKEQLMTLQEQVARLEPEKEVGTGVEISEKLVMEARELKRKNKELQLEKRVLAIKLVVTEVRITGFSNTTENGMVTKIMNEANGLKRRNKELLMQFDKLQSNRFNMVEEMVYQRWINACLRHEIKSYQTQSKRSSSSDLNNSLNQKSTGRSSEDLFISSSRSEKSEKISQKTSLIQKMKRWKKSMSDPEVVSSLRKSFGGTSSSASSLSRRSSTSSSATPKAAMPSIRGRRRRVSFSDSIKPLATAFEEVPNSFETDMDDKYSLDTVQVKMELEPKNLTTDKAEEFFEVEKASNSTHSYEQNGDDSTITRMQMTIENTSEGTAVTSPSRANDSDDIGNQVLHTSVVFVFLILLGLVYFMLNRCFRCLMMYF